ncbi:unnamed protein product [Penicillium glandicola]
MTSFWDSPRGNRKHAWESLGDRGQRDGTKPVETHDSQHDTTEGELIDDIYYINNLNQTVIAAWDLNRPDVDTQKAVRPRHTESLALGTDRRSKVHSQYFQPGGKFRGAY